MKIIDPELLSSRVHSDCLSSLIVDQVEPVSLLVMTGYRRTTRDSGCPGFGPPSCSGKINYKMAQQEFYDEWRSKILLIPGLPLESDTAASLNDSLGSFALNKPTTTGEQGPRTRNVGIAEGKKAGSRFDSGHNTPGRGYGKHTPREQSLTVSMVEEEEEDLREKFKKAIQEEQMQNKRIAQNLGVQTNLVESSGGGYSAAINNSSKVTSRPPYEIFRVSDIFKSALYGKVFDKKRAISNLFRYRRGASVIHPHECQLYTPNEGVSRYQEPTEFLKCTNCGLSMNSHQYLKFRVALNDKALEYLRGLLFYQEMINDTDIVILIGTGLGDNKTKQQGRENTLNMFLQQLSTCGLKVKDIAKMKGKDMKTKLYSKYLILNCPLDEKDKFEDYIEHPDLEEDSKDNIRLSTVQIYHKDSSRHNR